MIFRFSLYGFLKNQRYFEPFFMLALLSQGLSFFMVGVLYAFRSIVINLLEIPSGAIADSYGRRVTMITSLVSYILSFSIFALAPNVAFLFLAMLLYGIGDALRTGTHKAMIFEWLKLRGEEEERTRVYGLTRSWSKFGSAASAVVASILVILTDDFRTVFLLATIPYIFNLVNLIGYPAELDGLVYGENLGRTIKSLGRKLKTTIENTTQKKSLRETLAESMAWDGVFATIKDYIQPAMMLVFTASILGVAATDDELVARDGPTIDTWAVVAVGFVYTLLFLASGFASRYSHQLVDRRGSVRSASELLWQINAGLFGAMLLFDLVGLQSIVVLIFVALAVLQNLWRPVLITRIDRYSKSGKSATILSLESQAQRLVTLVLGPLLGLLVDVARVDGVPGTFWPLALAGGSAAGAAWWILYRQSPNENEPNEEHTPESRETSDAKVDPKDEGDSSEPEEVVPL
ncbi:MAG TPA: hypothetical protein DDW52_29785 [Planctomycetaceae bacterium]|nr:hypothetical protein [Planctomycetaceae bacterium]